MRRQKPTMRKLEDTSWLAQIIKDKMDAESEKMGSWASSRWHALHTLHIIINEADDQDNPNIYYDNYNGKRSIVICEIPSLMKHGTDFDTNGMQCKLRGLAERYTDECGKEYYYSKPLGKWMFTHRVHSVQEG